MLCGAREAAIARLSFRARRGSAMTERRVSFRGRTLKGGLIVLGEKAPKLECTVRNFTKAGAALQVSTTFGLPQHFDLAACWISTTCSTLQHFDLVVGGSARRCRSQWRTDNKIGVIFESV